MSTLQIFRLSILGAAITGLLTSIFFIIVMQVKGVSPLARYIDIWIPATVMFFFMRLVKIKRTDGHLHFWEGLYMGNIIGIVGGMISGLLLYIFITWVSPTPLSGYKEASLRFLEQSKNYVETHMGKEEYERKMTEIENFDGWALAKDESIRKIFYCFVLVPIISMINRKKPLQQS